jgi:hypothetical protein
VFVTRLDDDAALKKAADFMGEVFIFAARARSRCATRAHVPDNDRLSHSVACRCIGCRRGRGVRGDDI